MAYLEAYARAFDLPLALDEPVRELRSASGAGFVVQTDHARYLARQVVVATGAFQRPWIPPLAAMLPPSVRQLHSTGYRNPAQLAEGPVLVVGGGNTGVQLAAEIARTHPTTLAVGTRLTRLPQQLFGRSVFDWLAWGRLLDLTVASAAGRWMAHREVLIGDSPGRLASRLGVRLAGRVVGVDGAALQTADGERLSAHTIIWATGYRNTWPWLKLPVFDGRGQPRHRRGVTEVPGLYFLGLPWLHTRGSGLLGGVGRDAGWLAAHIGLLKV